jgi:hypothetical protein
VTCRRSKGHDIVERLGKVFDEAEDVGSFKRPPHVRYAHPSCMPGKAGRGGGRGCSVALGSAGGNALKGGGSALGGSSTGTRPALTVRTGSVCGGGAGGSGGFLPPSARTAWRGCGHLGHRGPVGAKAQRPTKRRKQRLVRWVP